MRSEKRDSIVGLSTNKFRMINNAKDVKYNASYGVSLILYQRNSTIENYLGTPGSGKSTLIHHMDIIYNRDSSKDKVIENCEFIFKETIHALASMIEVMNRDRCRKLQHLVYSSRKYSKCSCTDDQTRTNSIRIAKKF